MVKEILAYRQSNLTVNDSDKDGQGRDFFRSATFLSKNFASIK